MRRFPLLLAACFATGPAGGAVLRPYTQLSAATIHLSDLFDGLGDTPDRVLGAAPAPGQHIVAEAPQLAAIARDYSVDWRPISGAERATLERPGSPLPRAAVTDLLRAALLSAGAPADAEINLGGFDPPMVAAGENAKPEIAQIAYDAATGAFTATVNLAGNQRLRLIGQAIRQVEATVLARIMRPGSLLASADLQMVRVRVSALHGNAPLSLADAAGMTLRRELPAGQPLTAGDLARPALVARGATVHMTLTADGIALGAQGVALEAGGLGEQIRVMNPNSHAVVAAEITGFDDVRVTPERNPVHLAAVQ